MILFSLYIYVTGALCLIFYIFSALVNSVYKTSHNESKIHEGKPKPNPPRNMLTLLKARIRKFSQQFRHIFRKTEIFSEFIFAYGNSMFQQALDNPWIARQYTAKFMKRNRYYRGKEYSKDMPSHSLMALYFLLSVILLYIGTLAPVHYNIWAIIFVVLAFCSLQVFNYFVFNVFLKETIPLVRLFYLLNKRKLSQKNIQTIFNITFYQYLSESYCMLDKFIVLFYHAKDDTLLVALIHHLRKHEHARILALTLLAYKRDSNPFELLSDKALANYQKDLLYIASKDMKNISSECIKYLRDNMTLTDVICK